MSDQDAWNARYQTASRNTQPAFVMERAAAWLPRHGRALDVAGGLGRHAFWLVARGLDVTLLDVSDTAVARVNAWASDEKTPVHASLWDGTRQSLPAGPWDVVVCTHYLQRGLFSQFSDVMAPQGLLVFTQPTVENLTRHPRPSQRYLLARGELPSLLHGVTVLAQGEEWTPDGSHEAWVVARRA